MEDALAWSKKLKKQEISLPELIQEIDVKVKKINPQINGLVEWSADELLLSVQNFKINPTLPFSGVPIPLKILGQNKRGWKATAGAKLLNEIRAVETANFVKKLEINGFIAAGQTNTPEFGFKNITDPILYGPTRNPWNLVHSAGGSSGGAAAVVASGIFPMAGASDGGGSIRIPASFNGLIGLKPTRGAMPNGPGSLRGWQGASIDFAMTVSMRDTEALFYALKGNQKASPYHPPQNTLSETAQQKKLKIAWFTDSPVGTPVSEEAIRAVKKMIKSLEHLGHELTEITLPISGISLIESYYLMNGAETSAMFTGLEKEFNRLMTIEDMELMTWGIYQYGQTIPAKKYIHALNLWDQAAVQMEELFLSYDLLLSPTTAYPAPKVNQELQSETIRAKLLEAENLSEDELKTLIYEMFEKSLAISPYTQLANLTGQPAISLPTHLTNDEKLPLGVQFMASKSNEALLFSIGKQLEEADLFILPTS
ncbi:amidase [Enterococcus sp. LJL99]